MDDAFDYSMWVEIYNSSNVSAYNLKDYWFSDDRSNPTKWKPVQDKIIPTKSFGILYFERDETYGHANFKLDPEGGVLYLFNSVNQLLDSLLYPEQFRNATWGRQTDGSASLTFFAQPSPGISNNGKETATAQCAKPLFNIKGGFYSNSQVVRFSCDPGDTIYYTTNYSEPTRASTRVSALTQLTVSATTVIRARAFSKGKVASDIVSHTYFIKIRDHNLPVVSISTTQANLTDVKTGIYCSGDGTNGLVGNGQTEKRNYNQDWNRPVNFELFDVDGIQQLNQELDVKILGCWTRAYACKSLAICPKKKFGDSKLRYDLFRASKPDHKYKDIQLRNSGNDFMYSMMRDGFMQSIVMNRLPGLNYMAYEPAVIYLNGQYWGIQNLRERSNEDWAYSNYGLDDDEVQTLEATNDLDTEKDIATDPDFIAFSNYLKNNDVTQPAVYQEICRRMDVDNFMSYMMAEIYTGNSDWPHNNVKMWRKKEGGLWRWILSDTDFGMSLYSNLEAENTLAITLGESGNKPDWATVVMRRLALNETFRNTFIDRYAIHLSTTFKTERVNHIMDSLSSKIATELAYHKEKWGSYRSLSDDLNTMRNFSAVRPTNMLNFISKRFCNATPLSTLNLRSNVNGATYMLNNQYVNDASADIRFFKNRSIAVEAKPLVGHTFKHWERTWLQGTTTLIPMGSSWRYFDGSALPASNWNTPIFSDAGWAVGAAQLGYGGKGEVTTIGYGGNSGAKYTTSYYRYRVTIADLSAKSDFILTLFVDDGAAVYVNGTELGRVNLPTGVLTFSTFASSANNGITNTFNVPLSLLKEGVNLIAVEVHQCNATSSDVIFNLSLSCNNSIPAETTIFTNSIYTDVLTNPLSLKAIYEKNVVSGIEPSEKAIDASGVWPTLVTDGFTVRSEPGTRITVLDLSGRVVNRITSVLEETYLPSTSLKPGLYLIRVGNHNYKIMKR